MSMKRPYANKKGFTIVEVIVVIVVIGILTAITVVSYGAITHDTKVQGMQNDLQNAAGVLKKYRSDTGEYPATLAEADVKTVSDATFTYQRDYLSGSFCLMGTIDSTSYIIESDSRTAQEGVCPIINVAMNPGSEVCNWVVYGFYSAPVARVSVSSGPDPGYAFQTTTNSTANSQGLIHTITERAVGGVQYTCSMSYRAVDSGSVGYGIVFSGRGGTPSGAYISEGWGAKTLTLTTAWQRDSITFTTPTNTGVMYLQYKLTSPASGVGIRTDGIMCTEGSTNYSYADGDATGWGWLGTPGISPSKGLPL